MFQSLAFVAIRRVFAATLLLVTTTATVCAAELSIEEAGQLALKNDYALQAIHARSRSMNELSVAADTLPDPVLKVGFANLPTDTFELGQ